MSPALVGLSLSLSLSFILSASLPWAHERCNGPVAARPRRPRHHPGLDPRRHRFLDLAGAGDQLSNNAYRLLFSQPYDTYDWNIIESGYRLLLALTLMRTTMAGLHCWPPPSPGAGRADHARAGG